MGGFSKNIALLLVALGSLLMGLSLKVRHFENKALLVFYTDFETSSVPDHWVDYFLMELADTGEELPEKHVEQRESKSGFRKKSSRTKIIPPFQSVVVASSSVDVNPTQSLSTNGLVPLPGYYASLHLLHLF